MADSMTGFSEKCEILADLWLDYREDEEFEDFISYNDVGLPLAYGVKYFLCSLTNSGTILIEETWDLLLTGLEVEDTGFDTLEELLESAGIEM